jgi:hypothetical protein
MSVYSDIRHSSHLSDAIRLQELAPLRFSPVVAGLHRASPSAALDKSSTCSVVIVLSAIKHLCCEEYITLRKLRQMIFAQG